MKRIGVDARLLNQTGVGRYTRNLLLHLEKHLKNDEELYVYVLKDDRTSLTTGHPRIQVKVAHYPWHSFSEQIGFCTQLYLDKLDLMHFTYFSFPILYKKPFIITIHDLIPLTYKTGKASTKNSLVYGIKHAGYRRALNVGVQSSQAILTPTQTVKQELCEHFPSIEAEKIHVTYEGVGSDFLPHTPGKKSLYRKPYFMYVGNFYPHKNVVGLVEAFALIKEDVHLVLIGPEDYFAKNILKAIHEHSQDERITMAHGVTDAQLATLYDHTEALIHPSLAEGFGLQLLEASYFSCPILASNIPLFKEILGDNFTPFDPLDIYDIASKITGFIHKPEKKYLARKEIEKRFSFARMAEQTYGIYQSILTHRT